MGATTRMMASPGGRGARRLRGRDPQEGASELHLQSMLARLARCHLPAPETPQGERFTLEAAQACVEWFRTSVHELLALYVGERYEVAVIAYDLGMATGFYGGGSEVAVGLRQRYEDSCADCRGGAGQALLEGLLEAGRLHGRDIRGWVGCREAAARCGPRSMSERQ
ncbi:hypothetical protein [Paraburkholderia kururiensis]|nr:hypothetical protein [Paraburkholderia kururiensis]